MPVCDIKGRRIGRVRDAALVPMVHYARVDRLLLAGSDAWLTVRFDQIQSIQFGKGITLSDELLTPYHDDESMLRIGRDLLDQQIIDVTGRKVVRVNDVTFEIRVEDGRDTLTVVEVDVGVRSIFRRMLEGVIPAPWIRRMQESIPPHSIKWDFCNVVEPDPLRRLRLNISYEKLEKMHPADLADIVEDLSPAEREAIFETIDSEVAADALSEIDPRMQASILEALEPEKAADIVEEMDPGAAADLLAELPEEQSDAILEEMEPEERQEVEELLEFDEDSAAGCMTTDFVYLGTQSTVFQAVHALQSFDGDPENVTEIYLLDEKRVLRGAVPLARIVMAQPETRLSVLAEPRVLSCPADMHQNEVAEMFDKYNLHALAVVDAQGRMVGSVQADQVISFLREKL